LAEPYARERKVEQIVQRTAERIVTRELGLRGREPWKASERALRQHRDKPERVSLPRVEWMAKPAADAA
jgi:hypothetical protein